MEERTIKLKRKVVVPVPIKKEQSGKKIGDLELPQLIGKFVVMRQSSNKRSMKFAFAHEQHDTAIGEASRLNSDSLSKGFESRYLVMVVLGQVGTR